MQNISNLSIIVRSVGEATESACVELLQDAFPNAPLQIVKNVSPFSKAIKKSFELGIKENKKFTLIVDADSLLDKQRTIDLIAFAIEHEKHQSSFCYQGLLLDKFSLAYRPCGAHLYVTKHLNTAIEFTNNENFRPETFIKHQMSAKGIPLVLTDIKHGLHDFHQSYKDIIRKAYLHIKKHGDLVNIMEDIWKEKLHQDQDYYFALKGGLISKATHSSTGVNSDDIIEKIEDFEKVCLDHYQKKNLPSINDIHKQLATAGQFVNEKSTKYFDSKFKKKKTNIDGVHLLISKKNNIIGKLLNRIKKKIL